jgi:hypothetical protein
VPPDAAAAAFNRIRILNEKQPPMSWLIASPPKRSSKNSMSIPEYVDDLPVLVDAAVPVAPDAAWGGPIPETVVDGIQAISSGNAGIVSLSPLSRWDKLGA